MREIELYANTSTPSIRSTSQAPRQSVPEELEEPQKQDHGTLSYSFHTYSHYRRGTGGMPAGRQVRTSSLHTVKFGKIAYVPIFLPCAPYKCIANTIEQPRKTTPCQIGPSLIKQYTDSRRNRQTTPFAPVAIQGFSEALKMRHLQHLLGP